MKVDRITHSRDMVIRNFLRWRPDAILDLYSPEVGPFDPGILDLVKPEIVPFDPPSPKTLPYRIKHEVDRMIRCRDMAI